MLEADFPDEDSGFALIVPSIIGAEIDYKSSVRQQKQKLWSFSTVQMKNELHLSDPNELQGMAVNATGDREIST
jgi:hypothetical protein